MIATQTVWFKQDDIDLKAGWLSSKFQFMSWALSSFQLVKFFAKVELVTDTIGAELAIDKLKLPYTHVNADLETVKQDSYLWVSNKLYTYSIQQEPFLHLDTDAYFFNRVDNKLLTAPLVAQNFEYDHANYVQAYQDVLTHCPYVPDCITKDDKGRLTAVNAGLIGGTNVGFFREFTTFVTDFLQRNEAALARCTYDYLNVFVEQFLFKKYAEFKNVPITYVTPIEFGPPCDYKMAEFTQLPSDVSYIHVTNYKRNPTICEQLAQRLWLESPELYERVLTVCRELEATHHPISQPARQLLNPLYRTQYVLNAVLPISQLPLITNDLSAQIAALPDENAKAVLTDALQYEQRRQAFINALPDAATLMQDWQRWSLVTNTLLSLPYETYCQQTIRSGHYGQRIESEWNWAEVNEFASQQAGRDFAHNLQVPAAYYETMLYVYIHEDVVREQLLDALNMLILDTLDEPATIGSVMDRVCQQVLAYQPALDGQQLAHTLLGRIRHFLYHGVLVVSDE